MSGEGERVDETRNEERNREEATGSRESIAAGQKDIWLCIMYLDPRALHTPSSSFTQSEQPARAGVCVCTRARCTNEGSLSLFLYRVSLCLPPRVYVHVRAKVYLARKRGKPRTSSNRRRGGSWNHAIRVKIISAVVHDRAFRARHRAARIREKPSSSCSI